MARIQGYVQSRKKKKIRKKRKIRKREISTEMWVEEEEKEGERSDP